MEGGFVVEVDAGYSPDGLFGVVFRHSVTGEIEWYDYVDENSCFAVHCVRQLSASGYIAAGFGAYNAQAS